MGLGQQATEGPSTPREDHGKSKEHVLKKGKMLWVERGLIGRVAPTTLQRGGEGPHLPSEKPGSAYRGGRGIPEVWASLKGFKP